MSQIVFLPGFDGNAQLRRDFCQALADHDHQVLPVSYPNRLLGTLDHYRHHATAETPVDWSPILVAESFSGLVAARWAAIDPRVRAVFLCGSFARNPVGVAAALGASWPALVKFGQSMLPPVPNADAPRRRWSDAFTRALTSLSDEVLAERLRLIATEDVGDHLQGLTIPVVLVQYQGDLVINPQARAHLERVCQNAQVMKVPGPHFAIETKPREIAGLIHKRIQKVFPEPPPPEPDPYSEYL
jgi:pimeloyl-ACP methyl ester carboxylesterase